MKKGKLTVTITIGLMCLILTMLIFMQVRTISQTDISELEIMRESELKTELAALKTKYEGVVDELKETNLKILEYEKSISDSNEAAKLQQEELEKTENLLGKKAVTGKGIIINLSNAGQTMINAYDLIELVHLLKEAGAEAISINEQRLVYSSFIVSINELTGIIKVDGKGIYAPYTVKAIGNETYLESAIAQKNGYIDQKITNKKDVVLERATSITIPAYTGNLDFEYVRGEE